MHVAEMLLQYLSLLLSWPVLLFILFLIFRKRLSEVLKSLFDRMKRAEVWGQKFDFITNNLQTQAEKIGEQEAIIKNLVTFSMSTTIFEHLVALHHRKHLGEQYHYVDNDFFKRDLYFLRDHGYIESKAPRILDIDQLQNGADLLQEIKLTPVGEFYVKLRESMEDWRKKPIV